MYRSRHNYNLRYEVTDEELLREYYYDLVSVFGLKPHWSKNPSGKTGKIIPVVNLRSKIAFEDLLRYAKYFSADWCLKEPFLSSGINIKREFLRSFADDEGSVIPQGKGALVRLYSINEKGLLQLQKLLLDFDISSKMVPGFGARRNVFALTIKEISKFSRRIGFNLSRKKARLCEFL